MANEKQFRLRTTFVATRNVREYRQTIPVWVAPDDVVLEIGCEWGTTTVQIAPRCREVVGTDVSWECIRRARQMHPDIRFEVLDAFDIRSAMALDRAFTKIYVDISGFSGYRSLLDVISLLNMYAAVFGPEAIIAKSGALKHFASHCIPWRQPVPDLPPQEPHHAPD